LKVIRSLPVRALIYTYIPPPILQREIDMKKIMAKSAKVAGTRTKKSGKKPVATKTAAKKSAAKKVSIPKYRKLSNSLSKAHSEIFKDSGELLGHIALQAEVSSVCIEFENLKKKKLENPDQLLEDLKNLAKSYTHHLNFREGTVGGTVTKYRIQQGQLFLIIKKVVRSTGKNWKDWFKENFSEREFRSVQEFMQLAKKPSSMTYAVLGKDRLLKILRMNNHDKKLEDPIGDFLKTKGLEFNPKDKTSLDTVKTNIDIEINYQKLLNASIDKIPKEKVQELVNKGKQISGAHIRELQFLKNANEDLLKYMDDIIANGGRAVPINTPERKAESFKWAADKFLKAMETAIANKQIFSHISMKTLQQLKSKIKEMEQRLP